ncbi:hypothetical protein HG536_0B02400 [Torulaspora globosa]|uniref:non-specific serine/threonine protein kinase n=1 Tax=Torulaspora globosa TaxID=48254 RepID=A0A7G3ZCZ1_9SACH|nr:uncharacterized protein HG536_0B02400 [Torulaspora globosa]QLL31377.1 hypothetical protein HG536_0B02400 [Torulaspora globosa]
MGAQLSLSAQTSPSIAIFSYIDVLNEVHYVSQLNSSRFLKTCRALDPNGKIIIKVFIKPNEEYDLKEKKKQIDAEALSLAPLPTTLNYSKVVESNRAGYLIRQHLMSNLYDRLSYRPYLSEIEMKFVTFQLLQAVNDIHNLNICHGDIKTENVLVMSWDWIVLTDFSNKIKPTYLPEDNPGEFSFYFDTSNRRTCYLAPERFNTRLHEKTKDATGNVTKEMDIFSLGCCIAEIYAEGRPLFNLSQLFKYKNNEYDVTSFLEEEIKGDALRSLICDMVHQNPKKRLSCRKLLEKYRGSFFPEHFYTYTYEFFRTMATMRTSIPIAGATCARSTLEDQINLADDCCIKMYHDLGKICQELDYALKSKQDTDKSRSLEDFGNDLISSLKIPDLGELELKNYASKELKDESALLFISFLSHNVRNVTSSSTKLRCLEMLVLFSQYISDENKIDRVIPYLVSCFEDDFPNVQATAIQALTQVLGMVEKLSPINENVFMDYLLPRIKRLLIQSKQNPYVRAVIANCLGHLVPIAYRFQELLNFFNSSKLMEAVETGNLEVSNKHNKRLAQQVEELAVALLTDNETSVKTTLLSNVLPLCRFFGREKTNDVILSHLITYLNDKDASLRIKLIQTICGIAILLGPITLEQYILPLLMQTTGDSEELVVVSVLQGLKNLCQIGLVQKRFFYDICNSVCSLLLHPNVWIRQVCLLLIVEIAMRLSKAEVYCVLYPIVKPFFEFDVEFTHDLILTSCKQPVSRTVYNLLCTWSLRASKSLFWQQIPNKHVDAFGNNNISFITKEFSKKNYGFNGVKASKSVVLSFSNEEIPLTTEDKNWIDKFKAVGLSEGDLWKIAALRGYVLRTAKMISRKDDILKITETSTSRRRNQSDHSLAHVMPKNVFFDIEFTDDIDKIQRSVPDAGKVKVNHTNEITSNQLSSVKDMDGSLLLASKATATTTSNLENVYVQLDFLRQASSPTDDVQREEDNGAKFFVRSSYEGDVSSIKTFLQGIKIIPPLRDYKEFGGLLGFAQGNRAIGNLKGTLLTTLTENEPNPITSLAVSSGTVPYVISGSVRGQVKLWNFSDVAAGEVFASSLNYDFASTITGITMLDRYDCFGVSTKNGNINVLRTLYQSIEGNLVFSTLHCIRKAKIKQKSTDEIYAISLKSVISDNTSLLVTLTNTSQILVYDVRNMECIQKIDNPPSHGAVSSFCVDEQGSVLILGTTKGVIDVWDLRIQILINSWWFGDHTPITHLEKCDAMGNNFIAVAGGYSKAILTIWNYCKMACQQALINSDEQPSIENFLPKRKSFEELSFSDTDVSQKVTSLHISGSKIVLSTETLSEVLVVDVKDLVCSAALSRPKSFHVVPVLVTANLTYLLLRETSDSSGQKRPSYFNDNINALASANLEGRSLLVTADNSGIINVFN